ncbi:MAG: alpha-galactosidase [Chloroflexi bacterium]|nr:alpha-galactosidase [Chloroflexota bacterium]MCC6894595.1 alpha-galactosidase [Anaerolineae bacterium]
MTKIVFIGAGSRVFTRNLTRDILTFPALSDAHLVLVDTDPEKLDHARRAVESTIRRGNYPAKLETTTDRVVALQGADIVIITINSHGVDVFRHDVEIPMQYGVDINIGDTRGPSGIFRFMRTVPVMLDIIRDIERYAPNAYLLNYTNPMAMLCRAITRESKIPMVGLCHSVQGTAEMLAGWIGAPMDEVTYTCAGINHMAWYLNFKWNGQDAYPLIRKAITERPEVYNEEIVRNEMYLNLDHYVTESSGHNSEYNAWFRKRPDLIEKYCTHGTGWNPGVHAYIVTEAAKRNDFWREENEQWLAEADSFPLERGHEFASYIINALMGGDPFEFYGNVPNTDLISNLPKNACVEVPVWASKKGFSPVHVGAIPPQCAALTNLSSQIEEMAVEGALTGNPRLIFHAILNDPLTAAVCSMDEIHRMTNQMFEQNKSYLPQFKHFVA